MGAKLYLKKPKPVEAMQFAYTAECWLELSHWMGDYMKTSGKGRHPEAVGWLEIMSEPDEHGNRTLSQVAKEGDYIVKDHDGCFYRIDKDDFESTYCTYKFSDGDI